MSSFYGFEHQALTTSHAGLKSKEPAVFIPAEFDQIALENGWFVNLFSKEGRAENKKNRAKRKRARAAEAAREGNTRKADRLKRSADRLELKAASLEAKAEGIKTIPAEPKQALALWRVKYPFKERERITGFKRLAKSKTLMHQGLGFQPIQSFVHSEYRATIYGAIEAMRLAGIAPWTDPSIELDSELVTAKSTRGDYIILDWVKKGIEGLKALGLPYRQVPRNIKDAAEYLRTEVRNHDLEKQAWASRALVLMGIAADRIGKKSTITGITSATAVSLGGTLASIGGAATATVAGAVVGVPLVIVGGVIAGVGALTGVVAAGSQVSQQQIEGAINQLVIIRNSASLVRAAEAQTESAARAAEVQRIKSDVGIDLAKEMAIIAEHRLDASNKVMAVCAGLAVMTFVGIRVYKNK
jgi:hypothetical protein